ncbi:galactose-3-O-sulfotransferase 2 [Vanacampus margaritifer]
MQQHSDRRHKVVGLSRSCLWDLQEMLTPQRRGFLDQPLSPHSLCKTLCRNHHLFWMLIISLVVCVAIQTLVARQIRYDELPKGKFTAGSGYMFPLLRNVWAGLHDQSPLTRKNITRVDTERKCLPKSHIVFLKTHKTASSTILNILYRFGESRNLTFALPLNKQKQLFYPHFFASHFVEGVSSRKVKEFHIMCNHMRFRKAEVAKVMPADTFYFSIMRNPVAMMESIFIYYKSIPAFCKTKSLDDFLDNRPPSYNSSILFNNYAHNILSFDFGFDNDVSIDAEDFEARTNRTIAGIEQDFHLILISEYFDESMILLKHSLCWSLEDVASFKMNSRNERTRHQVLPSTAEKIKRWNALDWRIYVHFNRTFWNKVDSLIAREQIKVEVAQLKRLQAQLAKTCLIDGGSVDPRQVKKTRLMPFQYGAAVIQGYNLNPHIDAQTKTKCERLITPELQHTDILYNKQFPELVAKHRRARAAIQSQHSEIGEWAGNLLKRKAQGTQFI